MHIFHKRQGQMDDQYPYFYTDTISLSVGVAPTETNPFVNKNPLSLIERGLYLFFPDER